MKTKITTCLSILLPVGLGFSQGFLNLDFEAANVPASYTFNANPAEIFPDWTVVAPYITYDDPSLSGNSISIYDTNFSITIQGTYFVAMASGNSPGTGVSISIGQTGTIPLGTESIEFWGDIGGLQITFAGQSLAFSVIGSTANYNIYGANISAYAGDTGQLLFTLPPYVSDAELDNIQFSTAAVPEPGEFALGALGALFLGFRRWRNSSQ